VTVYPTVTTTYTIACTGTGGTATQSAIVTVTTSVSSTLTINTTQNTNFRLGYSSSYTFLAQSFKLPTSGKVTSVNVMLSKTGAPASPITVNIRSSLTGTNLATATIQPGAVNAAWGALQSVPIATASLSANTTYYLVLSAPVMNKANYYRWAVNNRNPYGNGVMYVKTAALSVYDATAQILYTSGVASAETIGPVLLARQLEKGSEGEDVSVLQQFLASFDHVYPEKLITGYYGSLTASAVSAFQNFHGLPSVGRVGPMTLEKLNELLGQ
jgi:murein L,D-transpeptidase YcbB/YkuD